MSRFDKLKRLKDEISRLLHEGFDENTVFNQLRADEQFAGASREQVQAFYSNLQEKSNAEAENEHRIVENNRQIAEHQQILERLQRIAENRRQIAQHDFELARKRRMKIEMEHVIKYEQNSNNFLIYDESFVNRVVCKSFGQGRFLMTAENSDATDDIHPVEIQDLFQGITKSFAIPKDGRLFGIYVLKFPFVLFHEFNTSDRVTHFCLVKFDFEIGFLQSVQSFVFNGFCQIFVNTSDASKFLLRTRNAVNKCSLIENQILIGEKLTLGPNFNLDCISYFDEQLCSLQFEHSLELLFGNFYLTQVKMLLYDLERNEHSTQDLNSTPANFNCLYPNLPNSSAWIRDTIFVAVKFRLTRKYGVIFTNPQIRNWKFVEFAIDLEINHIQSFADGTLMVYSEEEEQHERKIYKLQMRKPDFLRNVAWTSMVKLLKEAKIENPYKEARKYLPLNSEIQPFILAED